MVSSPKRPLWANRSLPEFKQSHLRMRFLFSEIRKTREDAVDLVIAHFPFERFNHTGGLAFHQGVKCLISLLVSFFFLHNECKSKNVNEAFPHRTHALLPPPASQPGSDLSASRGHRAPPSRGTVPAAPPAGVGGGARLRRATTRETLPSTAVTSATAATGRPAPPRPPAQAPGSRVSPGPGRGAARRPRFLCTLERVINLK